MSFAIMWLFEGVLAFVAFMYACANLEDYNEKILKHFIALFCLPFFGMQCFIWFVPAGLFYMHGYLLFCIACIAWIIASFTIVYKIENAMHVGL